MPSNTEINLINIFEGFPLIIKKFLIHHACWLILEYLKKQTKTYKATKDSKRRLIYHDL